MNTNTRGRYAAPRKSNPFYLLAALATGALLLAGACADTDDGAPDSFPVNAERRSDPAPDTAPEPEPVVDEPAPETEPLSDREIFILAMELTFDEASAADMAAMCDGVDLFGMETAVAFYAEGFGSGWDPSYAELVADELRARC